MYIKELLFFKKNYCIIYICIENKIPSNGITKILSHFSF